MKKLTTDEWIKNAKDVHGEKFDYSLTMYSRAKDKLKIICSEHGVQEMLPHHHTKGYGCGKCGKEQINISSGRQFTQKEFIKRIENIEGISFEKTLYKNKRTYVIVTCKKHGDYKTKAEVLLKGCGCPKCKSSKGENEIRGILESKNMYFFEQMTFPGCKLIRDLYFDFYIPSLNLCIEYDGSQHFKIIRYWGGEIGYQKRMLSDEIKTKYCKEKGISLLRIKHDEDILSKLNEYGN